MARLIAFVGQDERIASVMRKANHSIQVGRRIISIHSTNQLVMKGDVDVLGGKTGFIRKAGYCLATLLRLPQGGPQVAVVVLGADRTPAVSGKPGTSSTGSRAKRRICSRYRLKRRPSRTDVSLPSLSRIASLHGCCVERQGGDRVDDRHDGTRRAPSVVGLQIPAADVAGVHAVLPVGRRE